MQIQEGEFKFISEDDQLSLIISGFKVKPGIMVPCLLINPPSTFLSRFLDSLTLLSDSLSFGWMP